MQDFDDHDARLAELFAPIAEPLADDGFSQAVVGRIRRVERARRWALGLAVALGMTVSLSLWDATAVTALVGSITAWTSTWQAFIGQIPVALTLALGTAASALVALLVD